MSATKTLQLRRVFRVINGGTPTSDEGNWGGGIQWATPVDLGRVHGGALDGTDRTLSPTGLRTGSAAVPAGSLVVSTRAPIGYVAETSTVTAFNQGCRGLVPIRDLDIRFYRYVLVAMAEQLQAVGQGSTFVELSGDALAQQRVPVPLLETQRGIADFLDTETARIDALIAKKRRMIDLLEERKAAAMLAAAGGRLTHEGPFTPSSLAWLEERPAPWREVLVRLVAKTGSGHTPSRERPEWWTDCTIPWITTGEVAQVRSDEQEEIVATRERISELGLANSAAVLHPRGTVVLCRTASAGYSGLMGADMATSQDFATWTCGSLLRPRYLLLCLRAMRPDLLGRLATGSTHKTIYMPDIHALRIPLPPVEEQDRAVEAAWRCLHPLFAAMARLREQIALLQEHRQALITAAVTGELDVTGAAA